MFPTLYYTVIFSLLMVLMLELLLLETLSKQYGRHLFNRWNDQRQCKKMTTEWFRNKVITHPFVKCTRPLKPGRRGCATWPVAHIVHTNYIFIFKKNQRPLLVTLLCLFLLVSPLVLWHFLFARFWQRNVLFHVCWLHICYVRTAGALYVCARACVSAHALLLSR